MSGYSARLCGSDDLATEDGGINLGRHLAVWERVCALEHTVAVIKTSLAIEQ